MLSYMGKSEYCYANAAAMLLAAYGETAAPGTIEVLTGMVVGAFWDARQDVLLFDCSAPDRGLTRALAALGFTCLETWERDASAEPMPALLAELEHGPALLGPLDLGSLPYNPFTRGEVGADHYVLAYGWDEDRVRLHDPWGFPCVEISQADLRRAWRADTIPYRRGHYRRWSRPRRVEAPSDDELFRRALRGFAIVYREDQALLRDSGFTTGPAALHAVAERLRNRQLGETARQFLTHFAVPLAARRALDCSAFLQPYDFARAQIKEEHAQILGALQGRLMGRDEGTAADLLHQYALREMAFEAWVLDMP